MTSYQEIDLQPAISALIKALNKTACIISEASLRINGLNRRRDAIKKGGRDMSKHHSELLVVLQNISDALGCAADVDTEDNDELRRDYAADALKEIAAVRKGLDAAEMSLRKTFGTIEGEDAA